MHSAQDHIELGLIHGDAGNLDGEIAEHSKALALDPRCARAFQLRGIAYFRKGDHDGAIADFNEEIRLAPTARAFVMRGNMHKDKKDIARALEDYNRAIELDRQHAPAFLFRGILYFVVMGDDERALADWNEAIRLDPTKWDAFVWRGDLHKKRAQSILDEGFHNSRFEDRIASLEDGKRRATPYLNLAIADYTKVLQTKTDIALYATALTKRGVSKILKGDEQEGEADRKLSMLLMRSRYSWGSLKWIQAQIGLRRARKG
jgi:tetratricopeptide (TPR) repeat protein